MPNVDDEIDLGGQRTRGKVLHAEKTNDEPDVKSNFIPVPTWLHKLVLGDQPANSLLEQIAGQMVKEIQKEIRQNDKLISSNRCLIHLSPFDYRLIRNSLSDWEIEPTFGRYISEQLRIMYKKRQVYLPIQILVNISESTIDYLNIGKPRVSLLNSVREDLKKFESRFGRARLTSEQGEKPASDALLRHLVILGRGQHGPGYRIVIPSSNSSGSYMTVSSLHAVIEFTGDEYYITDIKGNGTTFIDGNPIPHLDPHKLENNQVIRLGICNKKDRQQQAIFRFTIVK